MEARVEVYGDDVEVLLLLNRLQRLNNKILSELDEVKRVLEEVKG